MEDLIKEMIDSTGLIPTRLAEELGVDRSTVYTWKNMEKMMSSEHFVSIVKIGVEAGNISRDRVMDLILKTEI